MSNLVTIASSDKQAVALSRAAEAINDMKCGKSMGIDLLSNEHFIYSDPVLSVYSDNLYASLIPHAPLFLLLKTKLAMSVIEIIRPKLISGH